MSSSSDSFPRMHISLYVADILQTVNFYTAFFNQSAAKVKAGYAKYILEKPSLIISFVENKELANPHFGHLGFQVDSLEELEARLAIANQKQLPVLEEMNTTCCYAVQDKFWVADPDGYQWEIYLFKEDAQFNDPRYQTKAEQSQTANVCCSPAMEIQSSTAQESKVTIQEEPKTTACAPGGGCC